MTIAMSYYDIHGGDGVDRRAKEYAAAHGCRCTTLGCQHYREALHELIREDDATQQERRKRIRQASARGSRRHDDR